MNPSRFTVFCAGFLSLAMYGLSLIGEAARSAAGLGFNEQFGVARLAEGFGKITARELDGIEFERWEFLAVAGMFAAILVAVFGIRSVPRWLPPTYLAVLTAMGGWAGIVMAVFIPYFLFRLITDPTPMDGEFFEDNVARHMALGVWLTCLLVWSVVSFIKYLKRPKPITAKHAPKHA